MDVSATVAVLECPDEQRARGEHDERRAQGNEQSRNEPAVPFFHHDEP